MKQTIIPCKIQLKLPLIINILQGYTRALFFRAVNSKYKHIPTNQICRDIQHTYYFATSISQSITTQPNKLFAFVTIVPLTQRVSVVYCQQFLYCLYIINSDCETEYNFELIFVPINKLVCCCDRNSWLLLHSTFLFIIFFLCCGVLETTLPEFSCGNGILVLHN